ncbi:peptidase dimerization domain protein [Rhizoctonia solani AG-3 Rhs1AP]|uniref:Peptidase dimerization domain protein n=1 Tax=Rhizoctonia solani AG-3 Rhs1AP TaxID=1086054 RepID=X8JI07_9AGAM|nr:peptidase dimerization domain protein [Rhizoctonia solani AG-3 Rhs1AP]
MTTIPSQYKPFFDLVDAIHVQGENARYLAISGIALLIYDWFESSVAYYVDRCGLDTQRFVCTGALYPFDVSMQFATPAKNYGVIVLLVIVCNYTELGLSSPGTDRAVETSPSLALQTFEVEYFGKGAHAGAQPWEGRNALDAVFVAYAAISALRQQIHPSARVHGIIEGRDWASNVIPDYAKMRYTVRAPSWDEVVALRARVDKCFEAGAHATACTMTVTTKEHIKDIQIDELLSNELRAIMASRYNHPFLPRASYGASTDFILAVDLPESLVGWLRKKPKMTHGA